MLSTAAQTVRPVERTPHHHLLCYRPAASLPQALACGSGLLTRLTWPASGVVSRGRDGYLISAETLRINVLGGYVSRCMRCIAGSVLRRQIHI
jgi:hypothetical protein